MSGADGERGVARVPGQGLFPSRKGEYPRASAPGELCLIRTAPTDIGCSTGAAP